MIEIVLLCFGLYDLFPFLSFLPISRLFDIVWNISKAEIPARGQELLLCFQFRIEYFVVEVKSDLLDRKPTKTLTVG
jgi:hypothetical protein